ncbi:MAG: hypothetical protein JO251_13850, partial [Verrucomicrobia bacterium]|nr:hypothetical protein [Verrucomicrobiota bacterium]
PWINYSTANVNFYYFYCLDEEFGPFFIKFCSYFPYTAKLCINGHEYLKLQLERRAIAYQALDNGIWWTEQLRAAQRICDDSTNRRSTPFFANGCVGCRIPSVPKTARQATAMIYPYCRRNFP